MDEDEQEDLLLVSVSESDESPEDSDAYLDLTRKVIHGPPFRHGLGQSCFRKRVEFLGTGILCLISATSLLVLLPLYLESSTRAADVYPSVVFCSAASAVLSFSFICLRAKFRICSLSSFKKNVIPPIPIWRIVEIGTTHAVGGLCILYALDRQRVLCHLQDPIKGVILVFSMIYYFCFCRKIMGLQKVFCATTIVVGLFVSVDYALCDEFHCRGYEREKVEDDGGEWTSATHFLWGLVYILGLAMWCFHYSLLEGQIVELHLENQLVCSSQHSLLETISCMVSSQNGVVHPEIQGDLNEPSAVNNEIQTNINTEGTYHTNHNVLSGDSNMSGNQQGKVPSSLSIVCWVYSVSCLIAVLFFWTSMIPTIGKSPTLNDLLKNLQTGIFCHFQPSSSPVNNASFITTSSQQTLCGNLSLYGWLFVASLILFSFSAYHFLILCQSAVFTVALMTTALPLANIFWSLFRLIPADGGYIEWWPNFTPELVCTLLGFPIITCGLVLFCKCQWTNTTQKELCCTLRYHPRPALT